MSALPQSPLSLLLETISHPSDLIQQLLSVPFFGTFLLPSDKNAFCIIVTPASADSCT
jgi:hypothetical protein